jgi:hypothetical protein
VPLSIHDFAIIHHASKAILREKLAVQDGKDQCGYRTQEVTLHDIAGIDPDTMVGPIVDGRSLLLCAHVFEDESGGAKGLRCKLRHRALERKDVTWLKNAGESGKGISFYQ